MSQRKSSWMERLLELLGVRRRAEETGWAAGQPRGRPRLRKAKETKWAEQQRPVQPEGVQHVAPQHAGESGLLPTRVWQPGEVILGQYRVERILGYGGMGAVYLLVRSDATEQRFAVKKIRFRNDELERAFLRELQSWMDLPDFPHLVACRFFRTIDGETVIFAEYVEGGSLRQWIEQGRVKEVDEILDVAIQTAWGLHCAHELGLVHQDVKSGNVLMTPDGIAKVSDFGLARARAAGGELPTVSGGSVLVSCGGMTPAYCSPEQAQRQPLSRKTDIWSWGVMVLEMFTREVTWQSGVLAPYVLEEYLKRQSGTLTMPRELADLLRQCFQRDPNKRPKTMLEVAEALKGIYRKVTGREYPRPTPEFPRRRRAVAHDRRTTTGVQWDDPRIWLERALRAAGRDPSEADALIPRREGSRQAQAVADLAAYEEARRIYERLVESGRSDLREDLAALCVNKAFVHENLADMPGALAMHDRAIAIYERLVHREGRWELANDLAMCYMNKANALYSLGDARSALGLYDRAIAIRERLVHQEGRWELANGLARCYINKAVALDSLGDARSAVGLYDRAIAICERLVHQEGRWELANDLAMCYMAKALALNSLGDARSSLGLYDRAIAIRERLVHQEGRWELANNLAACYMNKAVALDSLGDARSSVGLYDRAIAICERLVHQEGRTELTGDLARAIVYRAETLLRLGEIERARRDARQAVSMLEAEVRRTGRADLQMALNWARENFADLL
ncbi:MAG: serine/threonine-protein kinase [Candidatus Caldarchaeum sp.]